jgi:CRP-like cAMP-binding protein
MGTTVTTNAAKMAENWRVAMTALCNQFLTMHRAVSEVASLGPTETLIFLTISVANVQRLMRERAIPVQMCGIEPLPREWVVPISRNAIASATGLPRETVRRQVAKMIARGLLVDDPRGGVTPQPDIITSGGFEPILEGLMTEFARTMEVLCRTGAISIRHD